MLSQHLCAPLEQWDDALLSCKAAEARLGPMAATEDCHMAWKINVLEQLGLSPMRAEAPTRG